MCVVVMKKINYFYLLPLTLILTTVLICACSNRDDITNNNALWYLRLGVSKQGVITFIENVLWFYDFESRNKVVFSNQPDCIHQESVSEKCDAYIPKKYVPQAAILIDGKAYLFLKDAMNHTEIHLLDPQKGGRTKINELNWEVNFLSTILLKDSYLYFEVLDYILEEEEDTGIRSTSNANKRNAVAQYDFNNNEVRIVSNVRHDLYSGIQIYHVDEKKLVYRYEYFDHSVDFQKIDEALKFRHVFLYEIDLESGEEKELIAEHYLNGASIIGADTEHIYAFSDELSAVKAISRKDQSENIIIQGPHLNVQRYDKLLYYTLDNKNDEVYLYNLITKDTTFVKRPNLEAFPLLIFEDWVILYSGRHGKTVAIQFEDYVKGSDDYIVLE